MKKIIFLMCFYAAFFTPAFSDEINTADEVRKVKLEAKQKVQQIKADAKAKKLQAKKDEKQAKIDEKNNQKKAELDSKINNITSENEAKKAEMKALARAKKDKIDEELNIEIARLNNESNEKISKLKERYGVKKPENKENKEIINVSDKKDKAKKEVKEEIKEEAPKANLKPAITYLGINFETKKDEIMDELKLTEKQKASAVKLYEKTKEEIAFLNINMENTQKEIKILKDAAKEDNDEAKSAQRRKNELEEKMIVYMQKRDSAHNDAMKKFDNILEKEQKEIWLDIKSKGARLFPDIEGIR